MPVRPAPGLVPTAVALTGLAITGLSLQGCGPCQEIAAHREAFLNRPTPTTERPHLVVAVPQQMLDNAISAGINKITPKNVPIPGLGRLGEYFKAIQVSPRRLLVKQVQKQNYQIGMDLDVGYRGTSLFTMQLGTETKPVANARNGAVELAIGPDMLRSVKPSVSAGAAGKLTTAMLNQLPGIARNLIPRREVERLANKAVNYLTENAFNLLRNQLLSPMGALARFRFTLPDMPIESLELSSARNLFQIKARTSLPVSGGVQNITARTARNIPADRLQVRMSASAMVELANWAISKGKLPDKFDIQGKPSQTGTFVPAVQWVGGEQNPLKVNLWSSSGTCIRARVGARPSVSLAKGKVKLGIDGAKVEEIVGPPILTQAASFANAMWGGAIKTSKASISTAKLGLGKGEDKGLSLMRLALEGDELVFGMKVGLGGGNKARQKKKKKRQAMVEDRPPVELHDPRTWLAQHRGVVSLGCR